MKDERGFVNVFAMNVLIIIATLGIVAAIALPYYTDHKNRPLNEQARAHAYQAYEAAQAFFRADPKGKATKENIGKFGYRSSPDISLVIGGGKETLSIETTHVRSRKVYRVNAKGEILD